MMDNKEFFPMSIYLLSPHKVMAGFRNACLIHGWRYTVVFSTSSFILLCWEISHLRHFLQPHDIEKDSCKLIPKLESSQDVEEIIIFS